MKKTAFILTLLVSATLLAGCKDNDQARFQPEDGDERSLTITRVEDGDTTVEPMVIGEVDLGPDLGFEGIEGSSLETNVGYQVIRGTTPKNTHKVMVNDYTLQKYQPGQIRWSYITSEALGTLEEGKNKFEVVSFDKEGNKIDSKTLKITFNKVAAPDLPGVGMPAHLVLLMLSMIAAASMTLMPKKYS